MQKKIINLHILEKIKKVLVVLFSAIFFCCNSEEISTKIPTINAVEAVLVENMINLSWSPVSGTNVTYNVYRKDSSIKINALPIIEAKFSDLLTSVGVYEYFVTVVINGKEGAKGNPSNRVLLQLPSKVFYENFLYTNKNGITSVDIETNETIYAYDQKNIVKISSTIEIFGDGKVNFGSLKSIYYYSGDLISKIERLDKSGLVESTIRYDYNNAKQIIYRTFSLGNTPTFKSDFVYNSDGTVTESYLQISPYSGFLEPIGVKHIYQFANGNIVTDKLSVIDPQTNIVSVKIGTYSFDSKYNYNKNILGVSKFLLAGESNVNNVIELVDSPSVSFTRRELTYDVNNFISTCKIFRKEGNQQEVLIARITYSY